MSQQQISARLLDLDNAILELELKAIRLGVPDCEEEEGDEE